MLNGTTQLLYKYTLIMQNKKNLTEFQSTLLLSDTKILQYVKKLVQPTNEEELEKDCKMYFEFLSQKLRNSDKTQIQRISKFIIMVIMSGHLHLLQYLDVYFIENVMDIGSGVLKFKSLSPTQDQDKTVEPKKWRNQFVIQLVNILSEWFPKDLINKHQDSKYVKTIKSKKMVIKNYFLLTLPLIQKMQQVVSKIQDDRVCQYCKRFYERFISKQQADKHILKSNMPVRPHQEIRKGIHQRLKQKMSMRNRSQRMENQQRIKTQQQSSSTSSKPIAPYQQIRTTGYIPHEQQTMASNPESKQGKDRLTLRMRQKLINKKQSRNQYAIKSMNLIAEQTKEDRVIKSQGIFLERD